MIKICSLLNLMVKINFPMVETLSLSHAGKKSIWILYLLLLFEGKGDVEIKNSGKSIPMRCKEVLTRWCIMDGYESLNSCFNLNHAFQ